MAELRRATSLTRLATSSKFYTPSGIGTGSPGSILTDDEKLEFNKIGVRNFILARRARGIREDGTTPLSVWS